MDGGNEENTPFQIISWPLGLAKQWTELMKVRAERTFIHSPAQWFSNVSLHQNHPQGFLIQIEGPTPRVSDSEGIMWSGDLHFYKFPSGADAADGGGAHYENHVLVQPLSEHRKVNRSPKVAVTCPRSHSWLQSIYWVLHPGPPDYQSCVFISEHDNHI